MKIIALSPLFAVLLTALPVRAQDAPPSYPPRDAAQLDQLVGPIALYPDPLLGVILPASTHPGEVVAAGNLISTQNDPNAVAQQPWDDSVKALAQYGSVAEWMAQNSEWTNELGAAVLDQQQDVLAAIQRIRSNARASGMLADTPQQHVAVSGNVISILPAQSDTVYVPEYDPQYVESSTPYRTGISLQFGPAFTLRSGPRYSLDWGNRSVWIDRSNGAKHSWFSRNSREQWRPAAQATRRSSYSAQHDTRVQQPARTVRPTLFGRERGRTTTTNIAPTGYGPSVNYGNRNAAPQRDYRNNETRTVQPDHNLQRDNHGQRNSRDDHGHDGRDQRDSNDDRRDDRR